MKTPFEMEELFKDRSGRYIGMEQRKLEAMLYDRMFLQNDLGTYEEE